jgi:sugar-specific transcriptional regulator TrmB
MGLFGNISIIRLIINSYQIPENMREYINFSSKTREIWKSCKNEIEKILKENVEENGEVRIDLADFWGEENSYIRMADSYDDCFEYITSIGCKAEGDNVNITLYFNEDEDYYQRSSFDLGLEDCDDTEALIRVYDVVHDYFEVGDDSDE